MGSKIEQLVEKAKAQIILDHPFWANILYKRKTVFSDIVPLFGIDERGTIYVNPTNVEKLSTAQVVWGLCHEVGHWIGQHFTRLGSRNKQVWNYAGDAWINDFLDTEHIGNRIPNTVDMKGSHSRFVDEIYDELMKKLPPPDGRGGGGKGNGGTPDNGLGDEFVPGEDSEGGSLKPGEAAAIEVESKLEIAAAAQAARARGKLSANVQRFVDEVLAVHTPWHEHLEKFMRSFTNSEFSWRRPNRRYHALGHYLPSVGKIPTMGTAVIGVDTSGSITQAMLQHFGGHVNTIIEECLPEQTHVVYIDARVCGHEEFGPDQLPVTFNPKGGGGTDMRELFKWIDENNIHPDCVIVLTDGYTPFPTSEDYPTVWAITTDKVAPKEAGQTVHIKKENLEND